MKVPPIERLREHISQAKFDLAETALIIAQAEYPQLEIAQYVDKIDKLAQQVRKQTQNLSSAPDILYAMNQVLFEQQKFIGNNQDYYNPRNSFLNDVLDQKQGIPITLSILYLEIAKRLELPLEGVSFPGHFLVKLAVSEGEIILDPFCKGVSLSQEELMQRLESTYGLDVDNEVLYQSLETASNADILVRLLRNLKIIYLRQKQFQKALTVLDQLLIFTPNTADEWRDRGLVYQQLECFKAAAYNYQQYLELAPESPDNELISAQIYDLQKHIAQLH